MHRSPHTEESTWLAGVKGIQVTAFGSEQGTEAGGGAGAFIERTVVEGWIEAELAVSLVRFSGGPTVVPIDLLFKKPFHVGSFCPYIGIGPAVSVVAEEETEVFFGGILAVGAYLWLGENFALDIEVDYTVLAEEGAVHELTFAFGPTFRF